VGVSGIASSSSTTNIGVYGFTPSTATNAKGVFCYTTANTGEIFGVYGQTNSRDAVGIYGYASAESGINADGVRGETAANSSAGVYGYNSHPIGWGQGVKGVAVQGTGVLGRIVGLYQARAARRLLAPTDLAHMPLQQLPQPDKETISELLDVERLSVLNDSLVPGHEPHGLHLENVGVAVSLPEPVC
jgi:hypothetical protein